MLRFVWLDWIGLGGLVETYNKWCLGVGLFFSFLPVSRSMVCFQTAFCCSFCSVSEYHIIRGDFMMARGLLDYRTRNAEAF